MLLVKVVAVLEGVDQVAPELAVQLNADDLVLLPLEEAAHLALGFAHHGGAVLTSSVCHDQVHI